MRRQRRCACRRAARRASPGGRLAAGGTTLRATDDTTSASNRTLWETITAALGDGKNGGGGGSVELSAPADAPSICVFSAADYGGDARCFFFPGEAGTTQYLPAAMRRKAMSFMLHGGAKAWASFEDTVKPSAGPGTLFFTGAFDSSVPNLGNISVTPFAYSNELPSNRSLASTLLTVQLDVGPDADWARRGVVPVSRSLIFAA